MKNNGAKDLLFIFYLLVVMALTIVYFSVPERGVMLSNAIDWWAELLKIIL